MFVILQRPRHGHGHFLLLRAEFEIARPGKNSVRRKNLLHLGNQICADRLNFGKGNHFNGGLLNFTFNAELFPDASVIWFCPTLPASTQTIPRNSSSPKSAIALALAIQGLQTTVEAEPPFSTRMIRRNFASWISTAPVVSR